MLGRKASSADAAADTPLTAFLLPFIHLRVRQSLYDWLALAGLQPSGVFSYTLQSYSSLLTQCWTLGWCHSIEASKHLILCCHAGSADARAEQAFHATEVGPSCCTHASNNEACCKGLSSLHSSTGTGTVSCCVALCAAWSALLTLLCKLSSCRSTAIRGFKIVDQLCRLIRICKPVESFGQLQLSACVHLSSGLKVSLLPQCLCCSNTFAIIVLNGVIPPLLTSHTGDLLFPHKINSSYNLTRVSESAFC